MALFGTSGGIISSVLGSVGGLFGGPVGALANIGSSTLTALTQPSAGTIPAVATGPVVNMGATATPVMAAAPIIAGAATAAARIVAPILRKISVKLGRNISLSKALAHVRALAKFMSPAAVAVALGITTAELADLIVASRNRTRRRMNPANVKALRRSMRRLESFHKLCVRADALRGRGRRRSSPARTVVQCK